LGSPAGWEAALFDHFQALVETLCARLQRGPDPQGGLGGSTYSFNIWPGHPFEDEVRRTLQTFRERNSELRKRVQAFNEGNGLPGQYERVVVYAGQCGIEQESEDEGTDRVNHE